MLCRQTAATLLQVWDLDNQKWVEQEVCDNEDSVIWLHVKSQDQIPTPEDIPSLAIVPIQPVFEGKSKNLVCLHRSGTLSQFWDEDEKRWIGQVFIPIEDDDIWTDEFTGDEVNAPSDVTSLEVKFQGC